MEYLPNNITLHIPTGCFPLSTDSILLSDFVRLPKNARVLDLGSGCGTLGLLLCAKDENCRVTGVEINEGAHAAALENIDRNRLSERCFSICADMRQVPIGTYSLCLSNPPYFTGGPASKETPTARRDDTCTTADLFAAAARSLKFGGDFYLVHKPERLAQLCATGSAAGLEAKQLRLVRNKSTDPVSLILLQFRKGAKPGLLWDEVYLSESDGTPSPYYKKIYHL